MWWIEYVIRNKGTKFLRSAAAEVSFVKYFLLDVIGFVLGTLCLILLIIIWFISALRKFIQKKYPKKEKSF